jgi:hypothetical protein
VDNANNAVMNKNNNIIMETTGAITLPVYFNFTSTPLPI